MLHEHLRALIASNYAHRFWEWSYSISGYHEKERNGNGVLYEMILRIVFFRLWSHKSSGILTVKKLSAACVVGLGLFCTSVLQQICTATFLFGLWGKGQSSEPQSLNPLSQSVHFCITFPKWPRPSIAIQWKSSNWTVLFLQTNRELLRQYPKHAQITKEYVFLLREEALYSKRESKQLCQPLLV